MSFRCNLKTHHKNKGKSDQYNHDKIGYKVSQDMVICVYVCGVKNSMK